MSPTQPDGWSNYLDETWLSQVQESAIDADIPIVDPHHHLWTWPFSYLIADWLKDLQSGHNVVATVHTEAHGHYRADGPDHLKPVGETEYLAATAEQTDKPGAPRVCAGITGGGDLTAGAGKVNQLLDAHIAAGKGRFRGIRANVFVHFDPPSARMLSAPGWQSVVDNTAFREGVACLTRKGLCLDLVALHLHLPEVARLAKASPETVMIVNHIAPIADLGERPAPESELWAAWRRGIDAIAAHPNVRLKLGGCANPTMSHSMPAMRALRTRAKPPTSQELAEVYRAPVTYAIDKLGPDRCMFESNFPVDKAFTSYVVLWNAFKRLTQPYSGDERRALLGGSAARAYKLTL